VLLTPAEGEPFFPFDDLLSDRARRALTLARNEALRRGHEPAGPEHLLLGLLNERQNVAANILAGFGIGANDVGSALDELPVPEATAALDDVIEWAAAEAQRLGHKTIGTEHLLLGVLREGSRVASVCERLNVDPPSLRAYVLDILAGRPPRKITPEPRRQ
jgi:ATP-dependent Clp protease ATP-binding subunit ClpC